MFGSKPFGSTTSGGLFGSTSSGSTGFGFGSTVQDPGPEGTTIPFEEVKGTDTMNKNGIARDINTKLMCITAMDKYKPRAIEELRVFDYIANRKGKQAGSTFGSTTSSGGLFGQQQQQQAKPSLFGSTQTSSNFGSTTGTAFGSNSSAFGPKTAFGSGNTSATGSSLFGSNQTNTGSSLFDQSKPAFGQSSSTGNPLFGSKPAFGSTGTSQTSSSLFGKPSDTNAFGQPAATSSTGFGFGGNTVTNASSGFDSGSFGATTNTSTTSGGLFGPKPAGSAGFGFGSSTNTQQQPLTGSVFGNAQQTQQQSAGGLFGNTAQKPAGGLFGTQQSTGTTSFGSTAAPATGGLFNSATKPATGPLFGSATTGTGSLSGTQQLAPTQQASPPIILGSNVDEHQLQRKLIEAQLGSMPYGDNSFSKSKTNINSISPPAKLSTIEDSEMQSKLKKVAMQSLLDNDSIVGSPMNRNNESVRSTLASPQSSFSYTPIVPLPSLGFASGERTSLNLSLRKSPPKIPTKKLDSSIEIASPKTFDSSVLRSRNGNKTAKNGAEKVNTPDDKRKNVAFADTLENKNDNFIQPIRLDFDNVKDSVTTVKTADNTPQSIKSILVTEETKKRKKQKKSLSTPVTQTEQNEVEILEIPNNIEKLEEEGYYAEPSLKELVKMQYNGKVKIKNGLKVGRNGYGSVFFPGVFELSTLEFDKLIHFKPNEIIIYPNDIEKPPAGIDLNRHAEISLEIPYIKEVEENIYGNKSPVKIENIELEVEKFETECKKIKLDENMFASLDVQMYDLKQEEEFKPEKMVARNAVNKELIVVDFKDELQFMLRNIKSVSRQVLQNMPRIQWHPSNEAFMIKADRCQRSIDVYTIKMVPVLRDYFIKILSKDGRENEFDDICKTAALKMTPPSSFVQLLDSYLLSVKRNRRLDQKEVDAEIEKLLKSILMSPRIPNFEVEQRIKLGNWIKSKCKSRLDEVLSKYSVEDTSSATKIIFECLVNGSVKDAINIAMKSKLFNLSIILSLYRCPNSIKTKEALAMQFTISERVFRNTKKDEYMMKIYSILAGPNNSQGEKRDAKFMECLKGLSWIQVIGVFLWYSASPSDGIAIWAKLYTDLIDKGILVSSF